MATTPERRIEDSLDRAYALAATGDVPSFDSLVRRLRDEGFPTVLTDLRGVLVRRDLRLILAGARTGVAPTSNDPSHGLLARRPVRNEVLVE